MAASAGWTSLGFLIFVQSVTVRLFPDSLLNKLTWCCVSSELRQAACCWGPVHRYRAGSLSHQCGSWAAQTLGTCPEASAPIISSTAVWPHQTRHASTLSAPKQSKTPNQPNEFEQLAQPEQVGQTKQPKQENNTNT